MTDEIGTAGRPRTEDYYAGGNTLSQRQCLALIDSVGLILKEEAAKRGMNINIQVVPATDKPPTVMADREPIDCENRGP